MTAPVWIMPETVFALHERLIAEFGGESGLRDDGLLSAALARPQHLFTYATPSAPELAASYAFGIVNNHPFLDGNKRVGFTVAILFLELNGHRFRATEVDAVIQTLALATGDISEAAYAAWLARNILPA